jgi:hypothetical protein
MPALKQVLFFIQTAAFLLPAFLVQIYCSRSIYNPGSRSNEASTGGQEAVGWDGQLGGNPTWPPSCIVLTVCGCHAAGHEVASVARFAGWTAAAFTAAPAAWFNVS